MLAAPSPKIEVAELKNIEDAPQDNVSQKSIPLETIEKEVGK